MIGSTVAKLWADAGHDVRLASRHPDDWTGLVARIGSQASAGTPADAAAFGEVVMLTVPLKAVPSLGRTWLPHPRRENRHRHRQRVRAAGRRHRPRSDRASLRIGGVGGGILSGRPLGEGVQHGLLQGPGNRSAQEGRPRRHPARQRRRAGNGGSRSTRARCRIRSGVGRRAGTRQGVRAGNAALQHRQERPRAARAVAPRALNARRGGKRGAERRLSHAETQRAQRWRRWPGRDQATDVAGLICRPLRSLRLCVRILSGQPRQLSRRRRAARDRRILRGRTPGVPSMSATRPAVHRGRRRRLHIGRPQASASRRTCS